jgi:hypothetical protein
VRSHRSAFAEFLVGISGDLDEKAVNAATCRSIGCSVSFGEYLGSKKRDFKLPDSGHPPVPSHASTPHPVHKKLDGWSPAAGCVLSGRVAEIDEMGEACTLQAVRDSVKVAWPGNSECMPSGNMVYCRAVATSACRAQARPVDGPANTATATGSLIALGNNHL